MTTESRALEPVAPDRKATVEVPAVLLFLFLCTVVAVTAIVGATVVACVSPELFLTLWREVREAGGVR